MRGASDKLVSFSCVMSGPFTGNTPELTRDAMNTLMCKFIFSYGSADSVFVKPQHSKLKCSAVSMSHNCVRPKSFVLMI